MKRLRDLAALLAHKARNEDAYCRFVVDKVLDELGVPHDPTVRLGQFRIDNPFGDADLRLDYLLVVDGDLPMVVLEAKRSATDFNEARDEAVNYARNFNPREPGIQKLSTVPFIIAAAGERVEMARATARGIEIVYERIDENGEAAFLEWSELVQEAGAFRAAVGQKHPTPAESAKATTALEIELVKRLLDDIYGTIHGPLKGRDDERVQLLDKIILSARDRKTSDALQAARAAKLSAAAVKKIEKTLDAYDGALRGGLLGGMAAAAAYRDFITRERSAGGLDLFTGESQTRPYRERGRTKYRQTARYFTPSEIIHEMVRVATPQAGEKIIDPTCGSGGFLAELVTALAAGDPTRGRAALKTSIVGIDDDPFCVDVARTLLRLLVKNGEPRVHLHNCLYAEPPADGEFDEDTEADELLASGTYDLVIGNPPGNKRYSGTNGAQVMEIWKERFDLTANLWDCVYFVRRALDLAKPAGGRICLLLPDGFFANTKFQRLRRLVLAEARVMAIIGVPKVFRNTKAGMAILYAERAAEWTASGGDVATWRADDPVYVGDLPESQPGDGGHPVQLPVEMKAAVDAFLARAHERGKQRSIGLEAFGEPTVLLSVRSRNSSEDEE